MTKSYSYSVIITLLIAATSSFAALPALPPLPTLPAQEQEVTKPPPAAKPEPAISPFPTENSAPAPVQAPVISTAPVSVVSPPMPASHDSPSTFPAQQATASTGVEVNKEEHERFIDTGNKKLPRVMQSSDPVLNEYNASDLSIPAIASETKKALKDKEVVVSEVSATPTAPPAETNVIQSPSDEALVPQKQATVIDVQAPNLPPVAAIVTTTATPIVQAPAIDSIQPTTTLVTAPSSDKVDNANEQVTAVTPATVVPQAIIPDALPVQVSTENAPPQASALTAPKTESISQNPAVTTPARSASVAATTAMPTEDNKAEVSNNLKDEEIHHNAKNHPNKDEHNLAPLTADHIKFINDEAIVFTLPEDDIELGVLTEKARIDQMSGRDYIKLFWQNYETPRAENRRQDLDMFLAMYETHPPETYGDAMNYEEASNQAFAAASNGNLADLRAIITYYPVLQKRDVAGDNMLGVALEADNLDTARFLLMRGVNLRAVNYIGEDLFSIAEAGNNKEALDLLSRAISSGR